MLVLQRCCRWIGSISRQLPACKGFVVRSGQAVSIRMRTNKPSESAVIKLSGGILALSAVLVFVLGRLPIGHFWWDWISLLGAADAMSDGYAPFRDFWVTFLFPARLVQVAQWMAGPALAFMMVHFLQLLIGMGLLWSVCLRRVSNSMMLFAVIVIWVECFFPFNISHTAANSHAGYLPYFGMVNYNAFYNRFNGALLLITFVACLPVSRRDTMRDVALPYVRGIALGIIGVILLYSKITNFYVFYYCVVGLGCLADDRKVALLEVGIVSMVIFLCLIALEMTANGVSDYLSIIRAVAEFKSGSFLNELIDFRLKLMWQMHWFDIVVQGFVACIIIFLIFSVLFRAVREKRFFYFNIRFFHISVYYIGFLFAFILNVLTSYGDQGFLAVDAALILTVASLRRQYSREGITEKGVLLSDSGLVGKTCRLLKLSLYPAAVACAVYLGLLGMMMGDLIWQQIAGKDVELHSGNSYLDSAFVATAGTARRAAAFDAQQIAQSSDGAFFEPEDFVSLARSYGTLMGLLHERYGQRELRVLVLTLPAWFPAVIGPYGIPKGSYSWLHANHEFGPQHPPDTVKIVADADLVIEDMCEPNPDNRKDLVPMFSAVLSREFAPAIERGCWRVYERIVRSQEDVAAGRDSSFTIFSKDKVP